MTEHENGNARPEDGRTPAAANGGNGKKLPARELRRLVLEQTKYESALVAEPMDTGLWPTEGLTTQQRTWISEALRRVPRRALKTTTA
jgi:hypothetical protein